MGLRYLLGVLLLSLLTSQAANSLTVKELIRRKPQKIEGGRAGNLSERDFNRLGKAQKFMASEKYDAAIEVLDGLERSLAKRKFGLAQVYQTKGYVYAQSDRFADAAKYFKLCVELDALPLGPTLSTMYSLAQVYVAQEKYKESVPYIQDYIYNKGDEVNTSAYFFFGQVWAQLKQINKSIFWVEKAVKAEPDTKESWLRLLVALYYEKKAFPKAALILEKLVKIKPDKIKYWKQLSSVYVAMNKENKALATMEVAYKNKVVIEEKDIIHLVKLSLFRGVPYKAAFYLSEGLKAGRVEKTHKNYEILSDSYIQAQEMDQALAALSKAAPLAPNGQTYVRQGQIFLEKENYKESINSLQKGIAKGGLKKPGLAYLALGIAQYQSGATQASLETFRSATKYPKYKKQAREWINHLNTQKTH